jgi:hypothetical protein
MKSDPVEIRVSETSVTETPVTENSINIQPLANEAVQQRDTVDERIQVSAV